MHFEELIRTIRERRENISQIKVLSEQAGISKLIYNDIINTMFNQSDLVEQLTFSSFLDEKTQRNYFQSYQTRLKKLKKQ